MVAFFLDVQSSIGCFPNLLTYLAPSQTTCLHAHASTAVVKGCIVDGFAAWSLFSVEPQKGSPVVNKPYVQKDIKASASVQAQQQHLQPLSHLRLHSQHLPAQHSRFKPRARQLWLLSGLCRPQLQAPRPHHPKVPQHWLKTHSLEKMMVSCRL